MTIEKKDDEKKQATTPEEIPIIKKGEPVTPDYISSPDEKPTKTQSPSNLK